MNEFDQIEKEIGEIEIYSKIIIINNNYYLNKKMINENE
jgi:hypothetical protein